VSIKTELRLSMRACYDTVFLSSGVFYGSFRGGSSQPISRLGTE